MTESSKGERPQKPRPSDPESKRRRTRISAVYIIVAVLIAVGLNYLFSQQPGTELAYSELKAKIVAG